MRPYPFLLLPMFIWLVGFELAGCGSVEVSAPPLRRIEIIAKSPAYAPYGIDLGIAPDAVSTPDLQPSPDSKPTDTTPPSVTILSPSSGAQVQPNFTIKCQVTDNVGVTKVQLFVDNSFKSTRTQPPFDFPVTLKVGSRTIKVVGYDAAANMGEATITVTVVATPDAGVKIDAKRLVDQGGTTSPKAEAGADKSPSSSGGFGDDCSSPEQCQSGLCVLDYGLGRKYCTQTCVPVSNPCPNNADCLGTASGGYVCAPDNPSASNPQSNGMSLLLVGCSVNSSLTPDLSFGLFLALLLLCVIKRRQS
jgi:hypothetical protein